MMKYFLLILMVVGFGCDENKSKKEEQRDTRIKVIGLDSANLIMEDTPILGKLVITEADTNRLLPHYCTVYIQGNNAGWACLDSMGKWEISGDCGFILETMLKQNIRVDSINGVLRNELNSIKAKQSEYRYTVKSISDCTWEMISCPQKEPITECLINGYMWLYDGAAVGSLDTAKEYYKNGFDYIGSSHIFYINGVKNESEKINHFFRRTITFK